MTRKNLTAMFSMGINQGNPKPYHHWGIPFHGCLPSYNAAAITIAKQGNGGLDPLLSKEITTENNEAPLSSVLDQDLVFVTVMVSTRLELTRMVIFGRPSLEAQLRVVSEKIGSISEGISRTNVGKLLFKMITVAQRFESLALQLHDLVQTGAPEDPASLSDDMTSIHLFCDKQPPK
ncbi:hypothetical protein ARMGADRAFT_1032259 [Armillaria gallica]|uniref:Uncharacterized protein n=1 Tax=Armillaria gallica TaxID=47427 RepID=A0A2H3D641_ARMGA|nr:hypothetical protein ARMGADRAFT_1032259 [Armillaria gallica]